MKKALKIIFLLFAVVLTVIVILIAIKWPTFSTFIFGGDVEGKIDQVPVATKSERKSVELIA